MTTERIPYEQVVEDLPTEELERRLEAIIRVLNGRGAIDDAQELSVDGMKERLEDLDREIKARYESVNAIKAQLFSRARAANPTWDPWADGGTKVVAGEQFRCSVGAARTYEWDAAVLAELAPTSHDPDSLNQEEYDELVKVTVTASKPKANALAKRGGRIARLLDQACTLKPGAPTFEWKVR